VGSLICWIMKACAKVGQSHITYIYFWKERHSRLGLALPYFGWRKRDTIATGVWMTALRVARRVSVNDDCRCVYSAFGGLRVVL
jgi:hypothetical protein